MSSSANELSTEVGGVTEQETSPGISKSPMRSEDEEGEEEDEEEDIDFNPFLRGTPSPEASSSLSSEVVGDISEHGEEEITTQAKVSLDGACEEENKCHKDFARNTKKRKSVLISQPELEPVREKENGSTSSGIDVNDCMVEDLSNTTHSQKPVLDLDDEDAICRRTRARYSLASFTLDELEVFLQETDDDDDLQNVDDEEEYRKFLAAVLQGGDVDGQSTQEIENFYDEDEDNDADFEIELEEMLESDYDEGTADKTQKEEFVRARRRPETRQNRRQKTSAQYKDKLLEQSKRPLRPRLPILPNGPPIVSFPILDGKSLMHETASSCLPSTPQDAFVNGFSPHQIGALPRFESGQRTCKSLSSLDPPGVCSPPDIEMSAFQNISNFEGSQVGSVQSVNGSFWLPSISGSVQSVLDAAPLSLVGSYVGDVHTVSTSLSGIWF